MSVVHELGPTQFETDDDASESVITIPAAYLEDVRAALVAEIKSTSESLALDQVALLSASGDRAELCAADRDNALRLLRKDVEALDELRQAHGETRLAADAGNVLAFLLEAMVRLLAERLNEECNFGPLDMGAVFEIAERLRWAATATNRLP